MAWLKNRSKFHNTASTIEKSYVYPELRLSQAEHAQTIAVSGKWLACAWSSRGGASLGVIPLEEHGKRPEDVRQVHPHSQAIMDIQFHPYRDDLVGTVGDDGAVKVTDLATDLISDVGAHGQDRPAYVFRWNLAADSVVASGGADGMVRVWDASNPGKCLAEAATAPGCVWDLAWSYAGDPVVACMGDDKNLSLIDVRAAKVVFQGAAHAGTKRAKVAWLGNEDKLATTGFSKFRERQFFVWDKRNMEKPLASKSYGSSPSVLTPHYDPDTKLVYLAGRGESSVQVIDVSLAKSPYYTELVTGKVTAKDPHTSVALLPKRALDVMDCEVGRLYRATARDYVEVVHFHVSRRNKDFFADELFPPTASAYSMSAQEFLDGSARPPVTKSLDPEA
mmetsp:Transcript_23307/g.65455  ORF Transcript_23307/g.65455 Transcript_23307/m.65455 type:complete len:392 (+) Transcript_23307:76-1251(+)